MKNRILGIIAVLCMLLSMSVIPAHAEIVDEGTCGDNLTWTLDDNGTLTISGIGEMQFNSPPWRSLNDLIIKVDIKNGVTSIGEEAFYDCYDLTNITIPKSVTSIEKFAFCYCESLTSINLPNSITSIGAFTFTGCTSLTSITIPDSVTSIGSNAFFDTAWYNNQPDGLVYAGKVAYKYKGTMPENTEIVLQNGTKGIAGWAFSVCTGLTSITIPDSVTRIEVWAFMRCTGLTSITISDRITSIGANAFSDCSNLTDVYYSGSESDWAKIVIEDGNEPLTNSTIHYNSYNAEDENQHNINISIPITINVLLNEQAIEFDQSPVIIDGRTLVPLRAIFEALGAMVGWNGDTQTVTATKDRTTVKISIGDNRLFKNDSLIELDVPAQIINDRTLVPVRAISEAFGCKVDWDGNTKNVLIYSNKK